MAKQVAVFCNFDKPETRATRKAVLAWLRKNRVEAVQHLSSPNLKSCEFAVVLGGDGTMLQFAKALAPAGVPILGVNLGRLGFLAENSPKNLENALKKALDSKLEIEERLMLKISIYKDSRAKAYKSLYALNDCYLHASSTNRIAEIEASLNGRYLTTYNGDGLIIATPTGSTAYSLAASGPIVSPRLPVLLITPICPHTLAQRPLLISQEDQLEMKLSASGRAQNVFLSADGQQSIKLSKSDRVSVENAPVRAKFLVQPGRNYYDILRAKLKWGDPVGSGVSQDTSK